MVESSMLVPMVTTSFWSAEARQRLADGRVSGDELRHERGVRGERLALASPRHGNECTVLPLNGKYVPSLRLAKCWQIGVRRNDCAEVGDLVLVGHEHSNRVRVVSLQVPDKSEQLLIAVSIPTGSAAAES